MTDSKLSREHSLALLHKLATDDGFRSRFEQKPAAAFAELGIPSETIENFMASCQVPTELAHKDSFGEAEQQLLGAGVDACIQMAIPTLNLDFGKR